MSTDSTAFGISVGNHPFATPGHRCFHSQPQISQNFPQAYSLGRNFQDRSFLKFNPKTSKLGRMNPKTRFFRPGEYLFREGATANSMMLIKTGSVAIRKSKGSAFVELARVYHNEVIGELAFFERGSRNASALALTPVEVVEIDFQSLDALYKKVPPYLKAILNSVANRLREADETIRRLQRNLVDQKDGVLGPGETMPNPELGQDLQDVLDQTKEDPDSTDDSNSD